MAKLFANSGETLIRHFFVVSDLGLHCLPFTLLGSLESGLKWVNIFFGKWVYYLMEIVSICLCLKCQTLFSGKSPYCVVHVETHLGLVILD